MLPRMNARTGSARTPCSFTVGASNKTRRLRQRANRRATAGRRRARDGDGRRQPRSPSAQRPSDICPRRRALRVAFDARSLKTSGPATVDRTGHRDKTSPAAPRTLSVSDNDTLFYVDNGAERRSSGCCFRSYRKGTAARMSSLPPAIYGDARFSPDEFEASGGHRRTERWGRSSTSTMFGRGTFVRLTFDGRNATPIWSADGQQVLLCIRRADAPFARDAQARRRKQGGGTSAFPQHPHLPGEPPRIHSTIIGYIPDLAGPPPRRSDIVKVRLASADPPTPVVATPGQDYAPAVSPNGRFLAYSSDAGGRPEIFVRDLSGSGAQWQVSLTGGEEPRWSPDGKELYSP